MPVSWFSGLPTHCLVCSAFLFPGLQPCFCPPDNKLRISLRTRSSTSASLGMDPAPPLGPGLKLVTQLDQLGVVGELEREAFNANALKASLSSSPTTPSDIISTANALSSSWGFIFNNQVLFTCLRRLVASFLFLSTLSVTPSYLPVFSLLDWPSERFLTPTSSGGQH